ncbi:DUF1993 domain-containing protein [Allopontixanthobacter sediminis]|uniref:DUF1993 family protein n=1 Tax=Allopontixanthobacter sediminis TaxID=1689985 RepID=A0A845B0L7_9SPHN|nr:DUF1993 family protein [Allopontixanthobacter sediminis]
MSPENLLAPTYVQMLTALSAWLRKAEAQLQGGDAADLPAARLAPDMFPLATQIRFACVQALEGVSRLRNKEFPPAVQVLLDEGRGAGDNPGTIADAQTRIGEALTFLQALPDVDPDTDARQTIAHTIPNGMIFDLTAEQYARDWAIAQFYFHVMTAYAILRSRGVDLGKADYIAHMFTYLRPETMPQAE